MPRLVSTLALIGALAFAAPAQAAEQGALGATSRGEITISVTIAGRATMADLAGPAGSREACVWLDTATRGYGLTVLGGGVRWRTAGATSATIASGRTLAGLVATAAHPDCDHNAANLAGYVATSADPATPATLLIAPE